jgi:TolB protein
VRYVLLIDSAGEVMLADVDNDVRMPIGEPLGPERAARVTTAAWSRAGEWAAWSVDSADLDGRRELRLHLEETDEWRVLAESVGAFYLCPSPCGRWLSHLSPGPLGLELAVSDVVTGELRVIERGQPLFWSWAPDGSELAVHVEDRVLVAGLAGDEPRIVTRHAGRFIAPWWLPGRSVVHAVDDRLVAAGADGAVNDLVAGGSAGRFSLDLEGRRLALIEVAEGRGRLAVIDLVAAEHRVVTSDPVAAFFWSPDGSRLAVLVGAEGPRLRWLVDDGAEVRPLPPFRPSRTWAMSVLPFFEQYAHSHAHWSTDGSLLIAPALDDDGDPGAIIHPVEGLDSPRWLPDADLAWWV